MGIFATGSIQTTAPTSSRVKSFDTTSSLYTTGATLKDVTLINTGTVTVFVGSSAVTAATGLPLPPGVQLTYEGYSHVKGDTTGDIYTITSSGTGAVQAGLATVNSVD